MKHRILRKIRATFLSLSEEKKATSAGVKRLRRSRRPLAYSLVHVCTYVHIMYNYIKKSKLRTHIYNIEFIKGAGKW